MPFLCPRCNGEIAPGLKACPSCREQVTDFLRTWSQQPLDGKYHLVSLIGVGGMGEVYKAQHIHLQASRVIKTMRPHIESDLDAHDRFIREARMATRIQHPNVAALFDFSVLADGTCYMVWEYIDGVNLQRFVRDRGFLSPQLAVRLAIEALRGLESVHRAGIIHRDISPENLMVARDEAGEEHVKIIDLGVAKSNEAEEGLTKTGIFVGKLKYASPEQLGVLKAGERVDARSDIYSFGLVLYEMLTGVPPFQAETPHHYLIMHTQKQPAPLQITNPNVRASAPLESLLFRALEKDRNKRFASAHDFANALQSVQATLAPDTATVAQTLPAPVTESPARTPSPESSRTNPAVRTGSGPGTDKGSTIRRSLDASTTRRRELLDQVAAESGREEYQQADVALQTLRMYLGVRADSDPDFKKLKGELEGAAQRRVELYAAQIEQAKRTANPKEVARLLAEQDQKLGRRFVDATAKAGYDQWLRRRTELFDRARALFRTESFAAAAQTLEEIEVHLGEGAAHDNEFNAMRQSHEHALSDATSKLAASIEKARRANQVDEARKLLTFYDTRFARGQGEPPSITEARNWLRERRQTARRDASADRRGGHGSRAPLVLAVLLGIMTAAAAALFHWKKETVEFLRANTTGGPHAFLSEMFPPPPVVVAPHRSGPPSLDSSAILKEGNRWTNPKDGFEYVWIPGGTFEIGCVRGDGNCGRDEKPAHKVTLDGFWMSTTEATVAAFTRFAEATKGKFEKNDAAPDFDDTVVAHVKGTAPYGPMSPFGTSEVIPSSWPAGHLSWKDAAAYCQWSGGRLPTEAEWEYAAREREGRSIFPWGDSRKPLAKVGNFADSSTIGRWRLDDDAAALLFRGYDDGFSDFAPVGSYPANRLGLFDLAGNVWEWCEDSYSPSAYREAGAANSHRATAIDLRVLRGGGWTSAARDLRISARMKLASDASSFTTGCRCVIP
ncbi:MAG TPA: SUMF1/EgtB/PvdO family nonheme iron enzyme [Thermoanaerobaculia bacterium]|nr:SUMF1/EgtB/PvdO family nonheme iron enzyme [Thermoanaerobaculia bacterium]